MERKELNSLNEAALQVQLNEADIHAFYNLQDTTKQRDKQILLDKQKAKDAKPKKISKKTKMPGILPYSQAQWDAHKKNMENDNEVDEGSFSTLFKTTGKDNEGKPRRGWSDFALGRLNKARELGRRHDAKLKKKYDAMSDEEQEKHDEEEYREHKFKMQRMSEESVEVDGFSRVKLGEAIPLSGYLPSQIPLKKDRKKPKLPKGTEKRSPRQQQVIRQAIELAPKELAISPERLADTRKNIENYLNSNTPRTTWSKLNTPEGVEHLGESLGGPGGPSRPMSPNDMYTSGLRMNALLKKLKKKKQDEKLHGIKSDPQYKKARTKKQILAARDQWNLRNPQDLWVGESVEVGKLKQMLLKKIGMRPFDRSERKRKKEIHRSIVQSNKLMGLKNEVEYDDESLNESSDSTELHLFTVNHANIHAGRMTAIHKNLRNKMARGTYDSEKAHKAFMYAAKDGADAYHKEHGHKFHKSVRHDVATTMRNEFESEAKDGQHDHHLYKKYRKKKDKKQHESVEVDEAISEKSRKILEIMVKKSGKYPKQSARAREMLQRIDSEESISYAKELNKTAREKDA